MSFSPLYIKSYEKINFDFDSFMEYFDTKGGKKLLLKNNIKDINDFNKSYLYEKFIKNYDFYVKEIKKIDIDGMRNQIKNFYEELVSVVYHPKKLSYYLNKYNYNICNEKYEYYLVYDENHEKENSINVNKDIHVNKKLRTS